MLYPLSIAADPRRHCCRAPWHACSTPLASPQTPSGIAAKHPGTHAPPPYPCIPYGCSNPTRKLHPTSPPRHLATTQSTDAQACAPNQVQMLPLPPPPCQAQIRCLNTPCTPALTAHTSQLIAHCAHTSRLGTSGLGTSRLGTNRAGMEPRPSPVCGQKAQGPWEMPPASCSPGARRPPPPAARPRPPPCPQQWRRRPCRQAAEGGLR